MTPAPPPSLLQCYWVVADRFLAGEYPAHMDGPQVTERLDALLAAGIDTLFDLTEADELSSYLPALLLRAASRGLPVVHRRFPIPDFGVPRPEEMLRLLDAVDFALAQGHRVYVHCWGGVGRTGMAVGCYLVRHGRAPEDALHQIAAWRTEQLGSGFYARSPETSEQVDFVKSWSDSASIQQL